MKKKSSKDKGASAKKPSRASRATLRSGPAKKRGPSPSARSREETAKAERHDLYKRMLVQASRTNATCICSMLIHMDVGRPYQRLRGLHELNAKRPSGALKMSYWWPIGDWEPRIRAIKAAIKASAPKKTTPTLKRKP